MIHVTYRLCGSLIGLSWRERAFSPSLAESLTASPASCFVPLRKGFSLPSARMNRFPVFCGFCGAASCGVVAGSGSLPAAAGAPSACAASRESAFATNASGVSTSRRSTGIGAGTGGCNSPPVTRIALCSGLLARRIAGAGSCARGRTRLAGFSVSAGTSGAGGTTAGTSGSTRAATAGATGAASCVTIAAARGLLSVARTRAAAVGK